MEHMKWIWLMWFSLFRMALQTKCDDNKYCTPSSKNLIDVCITCKAGVDNTEWASSTCHSNLSDEKLPVYFEANKMNFLVKPECLSFTPLQEILKSLCIPFMQIILWELLRGGQFSIHGNVVNNIPADVNSVVNTLPKPINESQSDKPFL